MAIATKQPKILKIQSTLLTILLILFPLGQLTMIPLGIENVHLYLEDIVLALNWLAVLYIARRDSKFFFTLPVIRPLGLFIVIASISLIINSARYPFWQIFISSLYLFRFLNFVGIVFSVFYLINKLPKIKQRLIYGMVLTGIVSAIFGLIQFKLYPDLRNLYYLGWDPHYLRIFGTFFDPSFLGLIYVLALDLILIHFWDHFNFYLHSALIIIFIALALTYSRSSYIAFALSILFIAKYKKKLKLIIIFSFIAIATYFLLPKPYQSEGVKLDRIVSSQARIGSWQQSFLLFIKSPIFGIGFNILRYEQEATRKLFPKNTKIESHSAAGLDNSFFFIAVTSGMFGLLAFIYLIGSLYLNGNQLLKISLIAISVHSLFNNSFFYPWVMLWLWILVAISISTKKGAL